MQLERAGYWCRILDGRCPLPPPPCPRPKVMDPGNHRMKFMKPETNTSRLLKLFFSGVCYDDEKSHEHNLGARDSVHSEYCVSCHLVGKGKLVCGTCQ